MQLRRGAPGALHATDRGAVDRRLEPGGEHFSRPWRELETDVPAQLGLPRAPTRAQAVASRKPSCRAVDGNELSGRNGHARRLRLGDAWPLPLVMTTTSG